MNLSTNWVQYYSSPIGFARITRWLSAKKILRLLRRYVGHSSDLNICELGGANSCFMLPLCSGFKVNRYHVIDSCEYGLQLLTQKLPNSATLVSSQNSDVLDYSDWKASSFDLVFSVGLVEHFDEEGTSEAIKAHFNQVKDGGLVLITFPTPTCIYRLLRSILEYFGKWKFPDERPLLQEEVRKCCKSYGTIIHESLNYGAVFTQGYILVKSFLKPI